MPLLKSENFLERNLMQLSEFPLVRIVTSQLLSSKGVKEIIL